MKRFHMHVAVKDLDQSVRFYSMLFGTDPTIRKPDYAKWMLEDPRVNFAISTRADQVGIDHVGIQAENEAELEDVRARLARADQAYVAQKDAACCYARSNKYWVEDPQGIAWEAWHTLESIPVYGTGTRPAASAAPAARDSRAAAR